MSPSTSTGLSLRLLASLPRPNGYRPPPTGFYR